MEFKYIGKLPMKDLDLAVHGIIDPSFVILEGFTFEVPDTETALINKLNLNGNYQKVEKVKKPKRSKKEEDKKEEE